MWSKKPQKLTKILTLLSRSASRFIPLNGLPACVAVIAMTGHRDLSGKCPSCASISPEPDITDRQ
ncbi:MAG: hypothetical protein K8963_01320 [Proteobacteria bacterium]|nr:hypothetical protein [Pseudomonadota bacterium]